MHTTPTPGATPELGFPTPNQPYNINTNTNTNASAFGGTSDVGGGSSNFSNFSNTSSGNVTFFDAIPEQQQQQQQQQQYQQQQDRGDIDQIAARIIKRDAAWSTATRFLSFPRQERQPRQSIGGDDDVTEALAYLLGGGDSLDKGLDAKWESGLEHDIVSCAD